MKFIAVHTQKVRGDKDFGGWRGRKWGSATSWTRFQLFYSEKTNVETTETHFPHRTKTTPNDRTTVFPETTEIKFGF